MTRHVDWEQQVDWAELREYRRGRIVQAMNSAGLDGLLLTKLDAIRYAISFRPVESMWFHGSRYVLVLTAEGKFRFLVASGDFDRVENTMPWITSDETVPFPLSMAAGVPLVVDALKDMGLQGGRVGMDIAPLSLLEPLLESAQGTKFVDGQPAMDRARVLKHPGEVILLEEAAQVADMGMQRALEMLSPGTTEEAVAAAASHTMLLAGAEEVTHRPLVESGPHSWSGYRFPTDRRIQNGDMVYIDCGSGVVNGYIGDIARVAVVGKPTDAQRDVYKAMVAMLEAGTEKLSPGNTSADVVDAVKGVVSGSQYADKTYFGIIGHGIGTDMHEPPVIGDRVTSDEPDEELQAGMVVCLEPGILLPGVGGGHVENMIAITEAGPRPLNKTQFEESLLS